MDSSKVGHSVMFYSMLITDLIQQQMVKTMYVFKSLERNGSNSIHCYSISTHLTRQRNSFIKRTNEMTSLYKTAEGSLNGQHKNRCYI